MAQTRLDTTTTTIQPSTGTTPVDVSAEVASGVAQSQSIAAVQEIASQVSQLSTQVMRDETLKQAQRDAAQVVTFDAEGRPLPDTSGKGIGGLLYNQTYNDAALATYKSAALNDLNRRAEVSLAKYPNNPAAVKADLQPYVESTLKAMLPEFAREMTPAFSGVVNAAGSSAVAGKARSDLAGVASGLPADESALVLDIASLDRQKVGQTVTPTGQPLTDEQYNASKEVFKERFKLIADRKAALGISPEQIKTDQDKMEKLANAHAVGLAWADQVAEQKDQSQNLYGKALNQIDDYVLQAGNTPYAEQIRSIMTGYVNRAANSTQLKEQAIAVGNAEKTARIQMQSTNIADQLLSGRITSIEALDARERIEAQRASDMLGVRPTQALQMLMAGRGVIEAAVQSVRTGTEVAIAKGDANIVNAYAATQTNAANMQTNGATPKIREEGVIQAQELLRDPYLANLAITNPAAASIRAAASAQVAQNAGQAIAYDLGTVVGDMRAGKINPATFPTLIQRMDDEGMINTPGGLSSQQLAALVAEGSINYDKRERMIQAAGSGNQSILNGHVPSPSEQVAMQALEGTGTGGGGTGTTTTDAAGNVTTEPIAITPANAGKYLQYAQRNLFLPKGVTQALEAIPSTADEPTQKAAIQIVRGYQDILRQRLGRNFANPRELESVIQAYSVQQFGDGKILSNVTAYERGYGNASAKDIQESQAQYAPDRMAGGAGQQDPLNILSKITPVLKDAAGHPADSLGQNIARAIYSGFGAAGDKWNMMFNAFSKETMRGLLGGKLPADLPDDADIRMTADYAKENTDFLVTKYLPDKGQADRDQKFDPVVQGTAAFMLAKKDKIGFDKKTDPSTGKDYYELSVNGFHEEFKQAQGGQAASWDKDTINKFAANRMAAAYPDRYAKIDPDTFTISAMRTDSGRVLYKANAQSINHQQSIDFGVVDPTDKRWNIEREALGDMVAQKMDKNAANLIFNSFWGRGLGREGEMNRITQKLLDLGAQRDQGPFIQAWAGMVRNMRAVVGTIQGVTDEQWDKAATADVAGIIRDRNAIPYILTGRNDVTPNLFGARAARLTRPPEISYPDPNPQAALQTQQQAVSDVRQSLYDRARAQVRRPGTAGTAAP